MATVFRSQRVVSGGRMVPADVVVAGERIVRVSDHSSETADHYVDVGSWVLSPGIVDSHVHINEPGRTDWEGFDSATKAAAAGGITTVVDMPLNCIPATVSQAAAEEKARALGQQHHVDVAFWGGVIPGNAHELKGLHDFGCHGAKCFTCPSGVDEFPHVAMADLDIAMPVLRQLGMTLLVHAEAPGPLERAELATADADPRDYASYLRSRPEAAENEAIAEIIALVRRHGTRAHIVHLSSASALPMLAAAQAEGLPISAETCLHYLTFCAEEVPEGATWFKCAPPIRQAANREQLWQGLRAGTLTQVVSDHSPCTPQLKRTETGDFMAAWGGIAGLQLGLPALWTQAKARGFSPVELSRWQSENTAALAGLGDRKGRIAVGYDADLVVWDPEALVAVDGPHLHHRHKLTPYHGTQLFGQVQQTWLRGALAWAQQTGFAPAAGKLLARWAVTGLPAVLVALGWTSACSVDFDDPKLINLGAKARENPAEFSENFAGSALDTGRWTEHDSAANGVGAGAGNVRVATGLTIAGSDTWVTNGLQTNSQYTVASGAVEVTVQLTPGACAGGFGDALGYGDFGHGAYNATLVGFAYRVYVNTGAWFLRYTQVDQAGGQLVSADAKLQGVPCEANKTVTLRLVVLERGGAAVYQGNDPDPVAELSTAPPLAMLAQPRPVWVQHYSAKTALRVASIAVALPTAVPARPSGLQAQPEGTLVKLTWQPPEQNGAPITDYQVHCRPLGQAEVPCDKTVSSAPEAKLPLQAGVGYALWVNAINAKGKSAASDTLQFLLPVPAPQPPAAYEVVVLGDPTQWQVLRGRYAFSDPNADMEQDSGLRWLRAPTKDGSFLAIGQATSGAYAPGPDDVATYLRLEVTPRSPHAPTEGPPVLSPPVGPIGLPKPIINHVLSTGQSLSVGVAGAPALSTTQDKGNCMDVAGKLVPLVEQDVESPASAMGNGLSARSPGASWKYAVTVHGVTTLAYAQLKKGTMPFAKAKEQVGDVFTEAKLGGSTSRVVAVTAIHGEADHKEGNGAAYADYLWQWQQDYQNTVTALTGQTAGVPLFVDQTVAFTAYGQASSAIPAAQLAAARAHPGRIALVGPRYFLQYADGVHLVNTSYRWLGDYFAKAIAQQVYQAKPWRPLVPVSVTGTGSVITARFFVPVPPMVWDTQLVSARKNYGFEYFHPAESNAIAKIELTAPDSVTVTLSQAQQSPGGRLRYAYTGTAGALAGAQSAGSAAGNLRDSDAQVSIHGNSLYNWAVQFDDPVVLVP